MSSKMIVFLWMSLLICLNECDKWCPLIRPDNEYKGLGIYHRWNSDNEENNDYVMFNRRGQEWKFIFNGSPELSLKNMTIKMTETRVIGDEYVVNRFGHFVYPYSRGASYFFANCRIARLGNRYKTYCTETYGPYGKTDEKGYEIPTYGDFVVMKRSPHSMRGKAGQYVIFVNKKKKSEFTELILHQGDFEKTHSDSQSLPEFVQQMNATLFEKIDGVVDYNFGGVDKSGYLILFNINGKPKYCLTAEDKPISDECKSPENMKSLFDKCFIAVSVSTTVPSTKKEPSSGSNWTKIIIIVVVLLLIISLTAFLIYCKNKVFKSETTVQTHKHTPQSLKLPIGKGPRTKVAKNNVKQKTTTTPNKKIVPKKSPKPTKSPKK